MPISCSWTFNTFDLEDVLDSEIKRLRTVSSIQITSELQPVRVHGDEPAADLGVPQSSLIC